jgi:hypothetical protein
VFTDKDLDVHSVFTYSCTCSCSFNLCSKQMKIMFNVCLQTKQIFVYKHRCRFYQSVIFNEVKNWRPIPWDWKYDKFSLVNTMPNSIRSASMRMSCGEIYKFTIHSVDVLVNLVIYFIIWLFFGHLQVFTTRVLCRGEKSSQNFFQGWCVVRWCDILPVFVWQKGTACVVE